MDQKELFSSLVADIKNYNGSDPLRPWIHGIRKMKESLPSHQLKEKLPRFLQKCAQTFESDRRYRNDSRYLSVWIQLMDYVDDARVLLRKMESNGIGLKRAMFYSAYALYYEKRKRFEDAEEMYRLGVRNLAEPAAELQKSYNQFLHRMKLVKKRKAKEAMFSNGSTHTLPLQQGEASKMSSSVIDSGDHHKGCPKFLEQGCKSSKNSLDLKHSNPSNPNEAAYSCHPNLAKANPGSNAAQKFPEHERKNKMPLHKPTTLSGDDTVVVKFVGSAIVGKSEAEDACHHGLVDPTVNMKEAMNAISNMFREPLEVEPIGRRRSTQSKPKASQQSNMFEVYVDESSEEKVNVSHPKIANSNAPKDESELQKPFVGSFKIWTDDDDDSDNENDNDKRDGDGLEIIEHMEENRPKQYDLSSSSSIECNATRYGDVRLKEDTVVRRFVGSTVLGEPEVENACHHGLVDPTINMKEAMDDINSMFGKPLNFVRASKPKNQAKQLEPKPVSHGFSILADDDLEEDSRCQVPRTTSSKIFRESDLFEPTHFTKEAMADINEMFGKPLDF